MTDKEREAFIKGYIAGLNKVRPKIRVPKHKPLFETDMTKVHEVGDKLAGFVDAIDAYIDKCYANVLRRCEIIGDEIFMTVPAQDAGSDFEEVQS